MAEETPEGHLVESMSAEEEASPNKNDGNEGTSSEESSLGRCLSTLISTIIQDFDNRAEHTLRSQDQLSFALHRLTAGSLFFSFYSPSSFLLNLSPPKQPHLYP